MGKQGKMAVSLLWKAALLALGLCSLLACTVGEETPTPSPSPTHPFVVLVPSPSVTPSASPTHTASPVPSLGPLSFSRTLTPLGGLGTPGLLFPEGTQRIYVAVPFRDVGPAAILEERWYRNDELWISRQARWGDKARMAFGTVIIESLYVEQGLLPGRYRLELLLDGRPVQTGYFFVLSPPLPSPTATPSATWTPTLTSTATPSLTRTATHSPTPTQTPTLTLAQRLGIAYRAAVYLSVPRDDGGPSITGTGVIVDARGLLLTSFHVVADPWAKAFYNRAGQALVGVSADPPQQPVQLRYLAYVVLTDPDLDLALLHIKSDAQGRTLPPYTSFAAVSIGDDATLAYAPDVHLCGYPAGSSTAAVLHGLYSSHSADRRWMQMAGPYLEGYGGGMVLNDRAELVGLVISYQRSQQDPHLSWYYLRPINLAKPLLAQGRFYLDTGILPPTPTPAPPPDAPQALVIAPEGLPIHEAPSAQSRALWRAPRGTVVLLSSRAQVDVYGLLWREVWVKGRAIRGWTVESYLQALDLFALRPPAPWDVIAFSSNRSGDSEVYVMRSDGSAQRNLTNHPANDSSPSWSPDRSRLAFISDRDGNVELYTMAYDGGDVRRLTYSPAQELHPAWSPDGGRIAYVSNIDGDWEIWVVNADGSNHRQLTHNTAWDSYPSWSPDGRSLVFTSQRDGNYELYRLDLETGFETRLTNHPGTDAFPAWSPTGNEIAFISSRDGVLDLYLMLADHPETAPQRVAISTSAQQINRYPAWSPDGTTLLFTTWRDGQAEIYAVSVSGANLRNLTGTEGDDEFPAWVQ